MYLAGSKESASDETFLDVQSQNVKLHKHQDTGEYQNPRHGTTGCPVGPPGTECFPTLQKEDRLEAENLQLRIMLLVSGKKDFLNEAQRKLEENYDRPLSALRAEVTDVQERLSKKYGIDFKTQAIEPGTGRIIDQPK